MNMLWIGEMDCLVVHVEHNMKSLLVHELVSTTSSSQLPRNLAKLSCGCTTRSDGSNSAGSTGV